MFCYLIVTIKIYYQNNKAFVNIKIVHGNVNFGIKHILFNSSIIFARIYFAESCLNFRRKFPNFYINQIMKYTHFIYFIRYQLQHSFMIWFIIVYIKCLCDILQ